MTTDTQTKHSAIFINGGAGRVITAIPALEKFAEENPSNDFIIVAEGFSEFFKANPILHKRVYDVHHKNLFVDKIKSRICMSPEPYRVWEYYNQKCNLIQAFDIAINNKGIRNLSAPKIYLTNEEYLRGLEAINEVKEKTKRQKILVFQPFGRGSANIASTIVDPSGRGITLDDTIEIIKLLQKDFGVMLMMEGGFDSSKFNFKDPVATPSNISLRAWAGIISQADYFLGVDSVGQHIANSLNVRGTVLTGATYPENISYPDNNNLNILDFGADNRIYDPIRICHDEVSQLNNEKLLKLNKELIEYIVKSVKQHFSNNTKGSKIDK